MEHLFTYNSETAVVETKQGRVRGYVYDNISIFKGIPYAKAERFHAPRPVEPWEGTLDVTSYGYVCPLLDISSKPNGELLVPHRYWVMNEECQNLNIWTPACDDGKRPVLVWLHGGGFEAGSAIEQVAYDGENMSRFGNVVVVSVNHRLNVLGYCDLSAFGEEYANSGNAGTDDIIAALQWVRDNISGFGGDPKNVTVFGQSGGGAKVTTLLQTPAADGLYAKGINMSGVIGELVADEKGSGEELVRTMMKELDIGDVKELEKIPYRALAKAYQKVKPALLKAGKYVGGKPQPNAFYLGKPDENAFRPQTAQIPMMIGTVFGEFLSFREPPYDKSKMTVQEAEEMIAQRLGKESAKQLLALFAEAYPMRHPIDMMTLDYTFRLPTQAYIRKRSALNNCTYSYLFNLDMPLGAGRTPWHCSDIPYVFHNTELVAVTQEAGVTQKLEEQIFESVIAFAHTGNPNHKALPFWPASTPEEEHTMIFDKRTGVHTNHDARLIPLFAKYMEPALARDMAKIMGNVQH